MIDRVLTLWKVCKRLSRGGRTQGNYFQRVDEVTRATRPSKEGPRIRGRRRRVQQTARK